MNKRTSEDIAKDLGIALQPGEELSEEMLLELSGNKGDDDDE